MGCFGIQVNFHHDYISKVYQKVPARKHCYQKIRLQSKKVVSLNLVDTFYLKQHDCQEFLALLLDSLHEQLNQAPAKQISAESENTEDVSESCSSCSLNLCQAAKQITANSENTEDMSDTCSVCSLNLGQVDKTVPAGDNQVKQLDSDTVSGDVGMGASEDSNQSTISSNSSTITEGAHFFRFVFVLDQFTIFAHQGFCVYEALTHSDRVMCILSSH